jgi:hypothetical protein
VGAQEPFHRVERKDTESGVVYLVIPESSLEGFEKKSQVRKQESARKYLVRRTQAIEASEFLNNLAKSL